MSISFCRFPRRTGRVALHFLHPGNAFSIFEAVFFHPLIMTTPPPHLPPGVVLYLDFISSEEEQHLLSVYAPLFAAKHAQTPERKLRRHAIHYGPRFNYSTFAADGDFTPIPQHISDIIARLPSGENDDVPQGERHGEDKSDRTATEQGESGYTQATVQHYPPGVGIPPHIDTHSAFGEAIISFSFGAGTVMRFEEAGDRERAKIMLPKRSVSVSDKCQWTEPDPALLPEKQPGRRVIDVYVPPRSVLLMSGEGRYAWTHGIASRKMDDGKARGDRYSITFRSVRSKCDCKWERFCDSKSFGEQV